MRRPIPRYVAYVVYVAYVAFLSGQRATDLHTSSFRRIQVREMKLVDVGETVELEPEFHRVCHDINVGGRVFAAQFLGGGVQVGGFGEHVHVSRKQLGRTSRAVRRRG